jgi:hypothetical protein
MFSSVLTCVNTDRPETAAPEFRRVRVGLALPGRVEPGDGDQSLTAWAAVGRADQQADDAVLDLDGHGVRDFDPSAALVIALHDRQSLVLPWTPTARAELTGGESRDALSQALVRG